MKKTILLNLIILTTSLTALSSCGDKTNGEPTPLGSPEMHRQIEESNEIQFMSQRVSMEGKNIITFEIPETEDRLFLKATSKGVILSQYNTNKVFHNFGDLHPGGGAVTVSAGCRVLYEKFSRTVFDQSNREVTEADLSFEVNGLKVLAHVVDQFPLTFELFLPEADENTIPTSDTPKVRKLKVINNTFQVFPLEKRNLSDCHANGYPGNQFDIIGLREISSSFANIYGGKSLEVTLLKEL